MKISFILIPNFKDTSFYKFLIRKYPFLFNLIDYKNFHLCATCLQAGKTIEYKLFILIPNFKDSSFYKLLDHKYSFLFHFNTFPLILAQTISLITEPKNKKIKISRAKKVVIQSIMPKYKSRLLEIRLINPSLLQNEALFRSIYKVIFKEQEFINWGSSKVIMIQALINSKTFSITFNVKINNKTKFKEYWALIKDNITLNYEKDYLVEAYREFKILVWNMDKYENKKIVFGSKLNTIKSIEEKWNLIKTTFINKRKFSSNSIKPMKKDKSLNPFIIYKKSLLNNLNSITVNKIFVHDENNILFNFIYNELLKSYNIDLITILKDKNGSFIYIKIFNLTFLNSHRIFKLNENELINLFKGYDLYDSLYKAQSIYFNNYGIDLTTIVSTSTLAYKIFRINHLKQKIEILSRNMDSIIRNSYFGGGVHVFKLNKIIKNVFHYDINSLYPFAMLKAMPFKYLRTFIPNTKFKLNNNFFGFCKVEITISNNCNNILLPRKVDDKIVHSSGTFIGVYFSEELKLYTKNKFYKIKYLECYEFSKSTKLGIFKSFVNTFYKIKSESKGVEKFIAKSLLNNLYGFFGRNYDLIQTITFSDADEANHFLNLNKIVNYEFYKDNYIITYINNENYQIKSNVAIASAITAYARIIMYPYLINHFVLYTDTDSIFTDKPIDSKLIGKDIGKFKDEMQGIIIQEAKFIGPKRYGYWFIDSNNKRIEKSVYAGIERNSLTWKQIINLT